MAKFTRLKFRNMYCIKLIYNITNLKKYIFYFDTIKVKILGQNRNFKQGHEAIIFLFMTETPFN